MMDYGADTWFLLALWNNDPKAHQIFQDARFGKTRIVVSWAAFGEAYKKLMQRGFPDAKIKEFWSALRASEKIRFVPVGPEIAQEGAHISMSFGIPLMDAFIAATAKLAGCDVLLSSDSDMTVLARKKYLTVKSW